MSDSDDKFLEHLLPILASVALYAGGVYYWSYRVERNKEEAVKEFTECVKDHIRDPMHYLTPVPSLIRQLGEVASGETKSKLSDKSKREEVLSNPHFFKPEEWGQQQSTWKFPETPLVSKPLDSGLAAGSNL